MGWVLAAAIALIVVLLIKIYLKMILINKLLVLRQPNKKVTLKNN